MLPHSTGSASGIVTAPSPPPVPPAAILERGVARHIHGYSLWKGLFSGLDGLVTDSGSGGDL